MRKTPYISARCFSVFCCFVRMVTWHCASDRRLVIFRIPDHGKEDPNCQKTKSYDQYAMIVPFFQFVQLSLPVLGIKLVIASSHGDKRLYNISQHKTDPDKCPLATDKHEPGKQCQHDAGNREPICQYSDIGFYPICEKAFDTEYSHRDRRCHSKANGIFGP